MPSPSGTNPHDLLTTQQAADALGISRRRVRQLIEAGTLRATLVGRDYVIDRTNLDAFAARRRPAGRPSKQCAQSKEN